MKASFQSPFGFKVLMSYLVVILVGALVLVSAIEYTLPQAYGRHLSQFDEGRRGAGAGGSQGRGSALFENFRIAVNESLVLAGLAAAISAIVASLVVTRRWVDPIRRLSASADRIAAGHYRERIGLEQPPEKLDELGQLGLRFNKMAESLERVEALRRRLIGDVAHELRTPLSVIQGSMEALVDGVLPAEPATFQDVQRQAERLKKLVDDLQELSRVEAGAYELQRRPCNPEEIISRTAGLMEAEFGAKGVALQVETGGDLPGVLADPDRIEQVLINLLGNALRYTPAGGRVSISCQVDGRELRIAVRDSGQGIAAEHLPHLFERFYRADPSRTRASGGSGIGLTIARHIIEAHGGRIWAESAGLGRGSVFTFSLPLEKK